MIMTNDKETSQNISAGDNSIIVQAGRDAVLQVKKNPANIKLVRLTIEDIDDEAGQKQKVNIIIKNIGDTTAFLMMGRLLVEGSEKITNCNQIHSRYSLSVSDWTYDLNIDDPNPEFLGKHAIAPNEVVNFDMDVAREHGGAELTVYRCYLILEFDEGKNLETEAFFLKISGPTSIDGFYSPHGPSEEEWGRCHVDNIQRLDRIGFDFRPTIRQDSRKYVEAVSPSIFEKNIDFHNKEV